MRLGTIALMAFIAMQFLDGWFTYVGVQTFGLGVEANPVLTALMTHLGHGPGVIAAKAFACLLGVCLYQHGIHGVVVLLTGFYLTAAVAPWAVVLYF